MQPAKKLEREKALSHSLLNQISTACGGVLLNSIESKSREQCNQMNAEIWLIECAQFHQESYNRNNFLKVPMASHIIA